VADFDVKEIELLSKSSLKQPRNTATALVRRDSTGVCSIQNCPPTEKWNEVIEGD
jgi:hypothetical protein